MDLRDQPVPGVHSVAAFNAGALSLRGANGAGRLRGAVVSGNLFETIGVPAALGRLITQTTTALFGVNADRGLRLFPPWRRPTGGTA